mgnify:CR=1 FL=1
MSIAVEGLRELELAVQRLESGQAPKDPSDQSPADPPQAKPATSAPVRRGSVATPRSGPSVAAAPSALSQRRSSVVVQARPRYGHRQSLLMATV